MADQNLSNILKGFPTGVLCNSHPKIRSMKAGIKPIEAGLKLSGPAFTAKITPGQNAAIHRAVAMAKPGDVLVVDGAGSESYGPFGDILASACQHRGITGLVIDSTIRDSKEIRALGFPVFSLGRNPSSTKKNDPGQIDVEIKCGGIPVLPGDFVVADDDGVVVIPKDLVSEVVVQANKILEKEKKILADLAAGKTTCEIFNIPL